MSKFVNIMYTWHSFLNLVLIYLSYQFKFAYTLYPATLGMAIRCTIRIMDLEGSKIHLGHNWDLLLFQQIIGSILASLIIVICFANLRGNLMFSLCISIQLYISYLYQLDRDYQSIGVSAFIKDNWVVLLTIISGPCYVGYSMEIMKKIIVQKSDSLKKYKKFMNISE